MSKAQELTLLVQEEKPDIVALCETKLSPGAHPPYIGEYTWIHSPGTNHSCGVAIAYKKRSVEEKERKTLQEARIVKLRTAAYTIIEAYAPVEGSDPEGIEDFYINLS